MRAVFAATVTELAAHNPRVVLLTGDLGFMALEPFSTRFPERFFNVGVAEQNMVGLATGLAEAGFIPFVYSIATFAALRPYEFVRNGPIHHQLPVRIVGMGGGFEYASAGPTHHALEDVAVMRTQPGITVIAPADPPQARNAILATWDLPTPVYYRLAKNDRIEVPSLEGRFALGRAQMLREGKDVLLIAMGSITLEVFKAAEMLHTQGISSGVMVVASIQPPPITDLVEQLRAYPLVLTVEAHFVNGGLGSLVSEVIAEHAVPTRLIRCGVRDLEDGRIGTTDYLHHQHGISASKLVQTVTAALHIDPGKRTT